MLVVRTMMSEVEEHATDTDSKNATSEPPAKKMKVEQSSSENDFLTDLFCVSTAAAVKDELDSYLTSTDSGSDLLNYWRGKEDIWPKLSMCAKWVLSTPATSTSSERVFSVTVAGRHWRTAVHSLIQKQWIAFCSCMAIARCQQAVNMDCTQ